MPITTEVQNFTEDQITEIITYGLALVDEIQPADDLRLEVFKQACALKSQKRIEIKPGPLDLPPGNGMIR